MDSDSIYNYAGKIASVKRRLEDSINCATACQFLDALSDYGLSKGRVTYYAGRLPTIVAWFDQRSKILANVTKDDCRSCLRDIMEKTQAGDSKRAFAETLKKLIHFAKKEEIGEKKDGKDYVKEVAWIRPRAYAKTGSKQEIRPGDLLTPEEIEILIDAVARISRYPVRDRAMVTCLYEGAFRPGELLRMTIRGVMFKDRIAIVTTSGKTGQKTVPLLLSYRPLLDWIEQHPLKEKPDAPVWIGMTKLKVLNYQYLRLLVKDAAKQAGMKKRVWNYLLRHTRLTDVAKKHPDQILKKFGNWHGQGSTKMMEVYIHLSESDLENAVLKEHGLVKEEEEKRLTLKNCPRCSEQNTVGSKRCVRCGFILDEKLAADIAQTEGETLRSLVKRIERLERMDKKIDMMFEQFLSKRTQKSSQP